MSEVLECDEPDIRLFHVTHKKRTYVYKEADLQEAERMLKPAEYAALIARGTWLDLWTHAPTGAHEAEITRRCLVADEAVGFRSDPSREKAATFATLCSRWSRGEWISEASFEALPLVLRNVIYAEIRDIMFPTRFPSGFFG